MPKIMTLSGLGASEGTRCKCVRRKGRKGVRLCFVGKSSKHKSGWSFKKGGC